jgi:hypothetical protein
LTGSQKVGGSSPPSSIMNKTKKPPRLMSTASIRLVKYVFLDVVAYTKRTIDAQCDVITALNDIVKSAVDGCDIKPNSVIYIPTGDGICIALVGFQMDYDIHVSIAVDILQRIWQHNKRETLDEEHRFEVRIGINQSDDTLVMDINGSQNVAGSGINNARRIMDLADGSQILVSRTIYDALHKYRKYSNAFEGPFMKEVKYDLILEVYQLVKPDVFGLDANPPSSISAPEPKLTKLSAYYLAHSIKNEEFILNKLMEHSANYCCLQLLLWFLAKDSERESDRPLYAPPRLVKVMPDTKSDTIKGHYEWFNKQIPFHVALHLCRFTLDDAVPSAVRYKYLEEGTEDLKVTSEGKEKLKADWPEIWDEFGLG